MLPDHPVLQDPIRAVKVSLDVVFSPYRMGGGKEMLRDGEAGRMQQLEQIFCIFFRVCDNDIRPSEDIRIDPVTDPGKRTEDAKYFIDEFNAQKDKFRTVYLEADKTIYYPRAQYHFLSHRIIDICLPWDRPSRLIDLPAEMPRKAQG